MTVTLVNLSVCKCGCKTLKEDIPIGSCFEIEPDKQAVATYRCGGCREILLLPVVWCIKGKESGWIPADLFDLSDAISFAA